MAWGWAKGSGFSWPARREPRSAAAQALRPESARMHRRLRQEWQSRAAFFGRNLGVARFAGGLKADACSRCDLQVEKLKNRQQDIWEPCTDDPIAADALRAYRGKSMSQRELVSDHVWHYEITGEAIQFVEMDGKRAVWGIRSALSAVWQQNGVLLRDIPGGSERDGTARLMPYEQVRRLWVPDKDFPGLAVSPMQGVLRDCERYWALTRSIQRVAESALIQNGLIWYPAEADQALPHDQVGPGGPGVPGTKIQQQFLDFASRALEDDDLIESVAPFMMKWAATHGPPQTLDLHSRLDPGALAYITETLQAIGRGLDYPERLLIEGVGTGNHWSDWLLKEDFANTSVAPTLERVCWGDITNSYFRPALRALQAKGLWSGGDPDDYRVGFDMTPIIVHPDQSKTALELYKVGALGDLKLLEVSGFDPSPPDKAELRRWILRTQIMRESIRPQTPSASPPGEAQVVAETPNSAPGDYAAPPAAAALDVRSRVLESVPVGPMPGEEYGWLDD